MNRRWSFLSKDGKSTWNDSQMEIGGPYTLSDFNLNSEIELKIMRHFLLAGQISEKLAQANVRGW